MKRDDLPVYIFCLLVGCLYMYSVNAAIIASTIIETSPLRIFVTGLVSMLIFTGVFYNRRTVLVTVGFLFLSGFLIWMARDGSNSLYSHFEGVFLFISGGVTDQKSYGNTTIWLICLAIGSVTAMFMYKQFNFYVLALVGIAPFILTDIMNYFKDERAFYIFMICLCALFVRKMNNHRHGFLTSIIALPLCILAVLGAYLIPTDRPYTQTPMHQSLERPINSVYDFIYLLFNPKYFSFQATGFAGRNGELGGPVNLNSRAVMAVEATGRVYLGGLIKNHYDGRSWTNTLNEGDLLTDGFAPGHFEMLETAANLLKETAFFVPGRAPDMQRLRERYPDENPNLLEALHFPFMDITQEYQLADFDSLWQFHEFLDTLEGEFHTIIPARTGNVSPASRTGYARQEGHIRAYLPIERLYVSVDNRTGTVFKPPKGRDLVFFSERHDYGSQLIVSPSGELRTTRLLERFTGYAFEYLFVDTRLGFMQNMLNRSHRGVNRGHTTEISAEEFDALHRYMVFEIARSQPSLDINLDNFYEKLDGFLSGPVSRYADSVYRHYTALPPDIPQRVYDLALEITQGANSDYERAVAIESYLLAIPYTLNPPNVPAGADFVDFFLFEAREGYCTYYASAMAVLCRALGIPARYVEGYLTPPHTENGWYLISNFNAHAWAEVYLEGYGWLIKEATAPFRHVSDRRPTGGGGGVGSYADSFMGFATLEEYLRSIGMMDMEYGSGTMRWPEGIASPRADADTPAAFTFNWMVFYISLASFIILGLLYVLLQVLLDIFRLWRISRMPLDKQVQAYFKGICKMTSFYGSPMEGMETPLSYGLRLERRFGFKSDTLFMLDLAEIYYKARYSKHPITQYETNLMRGAYHDMVNQLRHAWSKPRFMFIRYFKKVTRA
jgi:hypothetical protein